MPRNHILGKDATCSILAKFLHPSALVRDKFPNHENTLRLEGFKVVRQEVKRVSRRQQLCVVCTHEDFPNTEMHAVKGWWTVTQPGPPDLYFDVVPNVAPDPNTSEEGEHEIPQVLQNITLQSDDVAVVAAALNGHFMIDDDNEPAPENVPEVNNSNDEECAYAEEWGHGGVCFAKANGSSHHLPRLKNHSRDLKLTRLQLFEVFFPVKFVKEVLLPELNKKVDKDVSYGEFLQFLGIWYRVATTAGYNIRDFWSRVKPPGVRDTPFKFNSIMARPRFEDIVRNLKLTKFNPPNGVDRFWEVRDIINAWNKNMDDEFVSGNYACLDESMSKWVNKYTCPGFVVVPRKPWSLGNEYHSICCALSGIMFGIDLVEGKDQPPNKPKDFQDMGKTVGTMLRLTRSLDSTGTIVIMDSGFCVLKGLIEMRKRGVFGSAMIKKRRYWPKHVKGDEIKAHFVNMDVGSADAIKGTLDGEDFYIVGLKEPDYILMFMSTYGTLDRQGIEQSRQFKDAVNGDQTVQFKYPEIAKNHYDNRDSVDNHNGRRMFPLAIEEQVGTKRWAIRVFQFLLAITEVNVNYGMHEFFDAELEDEIDFRWNISEELLYNPYLLEGHRRVVPVRSVRKMPFADHHLESLPPFKTFCGNGHKTCKTKYIQRKCATCKNEVRTYCTCNIGTPMCTRCFPQHLYNVFSDK